MFGQPNTPFGGGGFGQQQQTNTAPVFGSPSPAQQPGSLFGSPQPAFGQPAFGAQQQPAPTSTAFGAFGTQQQPTTPAPVGMFGAPAPANTGFGSGGAFGAPAAPTNTFGSTNTGGGLFGSNPSGGGFSQPAAGGGLFGQAPSPSTTFGAPTSTFGAPATSFGGMTGGSLFGSAPATTPTAFGAPAPSAFGAPAPAFGAPSQSIFGAPAPATGGFFGSTAPAPFGAPAPAPVGGLFGSPPAPSTGFGGTTSLFGGAPAPSAFGTPAPSTGFGAPSSGGLFSSASSVSSTGGTRIAPYQVTARQDGTATINLQSISAMEQYKDQSHEELRFADYSQGNRGTASPAPAAFGGFGAPAPSPLGGGLFGNNPAPTSTFGSTSGGLFGSNPAPAFGAAPAPLGGFGQTSTTGGNLFGQTPAPTSTFGSPAPAFGSSAPAFGAPAPSGGLFGAPAPSGLFGSTPAPSTFGAAAPAPTGLFGGTQAPSTGFGGTSLFGSNPAPAQFGAPSPGGLFGAPAPTTGLFGSSSPAAPFGQTSAFGTSAPAPSLFGGAPSSLFGAPAPVGYFGQSPPAQQQPYPQQLQPVQIQPMLNAQIIPSGVSEVLDQQIRALNNQLEENKKLEVWRGPKSSISPASTPTSNHNPSPFFSRNGQTEGLSTVTPRSTGQLRPRGFAQSEPTKSVVAALSSGRDNSALMSPEGFARSSQLNLVVRPDSLRRSNRLNVQRLNQESTTKSSIPELTIDPVPIEASTTEEANDNGAESTKHDDSQGATRTSRVSQIVEEPTKSPGFEYYQQVIGASRQSSHLPITPVTNGTSNGSHWYIPTLTKDGYEVSPTIEELSAMSEAELASVRGFTVSRPGYGKIKWEGTVDVRGANLDEIVIIESKDVSVYSSDEEKGTKPERGTKLNRPAVITYEGVFPKEGALATKEAKERFTNKVKNATETMEDAEFVSYDSNTGIWVIRVSHFSRYALVDDDDSDHDKQNSSNQGDSGAMPMVKEKFVRKATPYKSTRLSFTDLNDIDDDNVMEDGVSRIEDEAEEMDIRLQAEQAALSLKATIEEKIVFPDSSVGIEMDTDTDTDEQDEEEDEDDESIESLVPDETRMDDDFTKDELLFASRGFSFCRDDVKLNPSHDMCTTRMSRSFRAGWFANGNFLKVNPTQNGYTQSLVISHPVLADSTNISISVSLLNSQQANGIVHATGVDECPLFSMPRNFGHIMSTLSNSDITKLAFLLLSRLFSLNGIEGTSHLTDEEVPLDARNITAARKFLLDLCSLDESQTLTKSNESVSSKIYEALSVGNTQLACQLATSSGYSMLATVIASNPACQDDIVQLLNEIAQTNGLKQTVDPTIFRILEHASGKHTWNDKSINTTDNTYDWRRCLALRILERPDDTLKQILSGYELSLTTNDVPYPSPSYLLGSTSNVKSLFYKLLQICSNPMSMTVCEAIDPSGFSSHLHDFYFPFHLACAMASISGDLFPLSRVDAEYIKDGYVSQLISHGYWEWGVFVLLCNIGNDHSTVLGQDKQSYYLHNTLRAKNMIFQYFNSYDPRAEERRKFLVSSVGVPSYWFDEALCYRNAVLDGKLDDCMEYLFAYDTDLWRDAFMVHICPKLLFQATNTTDLLSSLYDVALDALPESIATAMYQYAEFEKRFKLYQKKMMESFDDDDNISNDNELQMFRDNIDHLYECFSTFSTIMSSSSSSSMLQEPSLYFIPTLKNTVPLSSMIAEVLYNVTKWRNQVMCDTH